MGSRIRSLVIGTAVPLAMLAPAGASEAPALPAEVAREAPGLHELGAGKLTFLFWKIYDIALYASGAQWQPQRPYALAVVYARGFTGAEIADEGVRQMRRLGYADGRDLERWRADMLQAFPGVAPGDRVAAVWLPPGDLQVYIDDKMTAEFKDPAFATAFFGMWLDPRTSEPALRRALLGADR
ncbi:MAG TPA: chalcone isomerase family protein [Gammaproteobacteria bacterium]|nr:chalcone isomerase family protein [Gammaproteobacteria bacterium]